MRLTKAAIEKFTCPPGKSQAFLWDDSPVGFGVRCTSGGAKSFVVQKRVNGKERRITLGPTSILPLVGDDSHPDESRHGARKRATLVLAGMLTGIDPVERKQARIAAAKAEEAQALTLRQVMEDYLRDRKLKPLSQADIKKHVTKNFAAWADRPARDITEELCVARYREMKERAPAQASQAFSILQSLLKFARATTKVNGKYTLPENPVAVLHESGLWYRPKARTGRIPPKKIGETWCVLREQRASAEDHISVGTAADLVTFLLLTGARIGEASSLTWAQVQLAEDEGSWHLPDPKGGRPLTIPLSRPARELLAARPRIKNCAFVFPARTGKGFMKDPRATFDLVGNAAGCHISAHDLRRTFTQIGLDLGIEMWRVELLTGHVPQTVTLRHYVETNDLRYMAADIERIGAWIIEQGKVAQAMRNGTNVHQLAA